MRPKLLSALTVLLLVGAIPGTASVADEAPCAVNVTLSTVAVPHSCGLALLGAVDLSDGGAGQVAVHDDLVAVVRRDEGMVTLVDVSDPTTPVALGSYDGGTGLDPVDNPLDGDVAFSDDGRLLFYARQTSDYSNEGLHVLDVSDPAAPRLTDFAAQGGMLRVAYARVGDAEIVAALDAIHGLTIFRVVRTPLTAHVVPVHVDPMPLLGVGGPASAGLEIVADDPVFGGPTLYLTQGKSGLRVLDLDDPTDPAVLAEWNVRGLAAFVLEHGDGEVLVHAAAEYWFTDATPPYLHTVRVSADGTTTEIARRNLGPFDGGRAWKLGGMAWVDGELALAHGHAGLVAIDPGSSVVRRATTDLGTPGTPDPDLGGAAWYAMDVVADGGNLYVTDAATGELRVFSRH